MLNKQHFAPEKKKIKMTLITLRGSFRFLFAFNSNVRLLMIDRGTLNFSFIPVCLKNLRTSLTFLWSYMLQETPDKCTRPSFEKIVKTKFP